MKDIYCLFSVDNNYDQPPNNLVAWWNEKPDMFVLAEALGYPFPCEKDEDTLKVVNIWQGKEERMNWDTHYRLEAIGEGVLCND